MHRMRVARLDPGRTRARRGRRSRALPSSTDAEWRARSVEHTFVSSGIEGRSGWRIPCCHWPFAGTNRAMTGDYRPRSFAELFEERVELSPGHTALVFGDKSLTYDELNRRA